MCQKRGKNYNMELQLRETEKYAFAVKIPPFTEVQDQHSGTPSLSLNLKSIYRLLIILRDDVNDDVWKRKTICLR